jgi:hypothetical protein
LPNKFASLVRLIDAVNLCQLAALNDSTAPSRSFVSRTSTRPGAATSTHCPPFDPL